MSIADETENIVPITRKVYVITDRHSGAWKIAYADFVTAMMAFFLLLWLLNATSGSQAVGIGDYFSPSVDVEHPSQLTEILQGLTFDPDNVLTSITGTPSTTVDTPNLGGEERGQLDGKTRAVKELKNFNTSNIPDDDIPDVEQIGEGSGHILSILLENPQLQEKKNSFTVEDTPLGARLHILLPGFENVFESRISERISDDVKRELAVVMSFLTQIDNKIIISGHTDNLGGWPSNIDKWSVSLGRALNIYDWLIFLGLSAERVVRLEALADTHPIRFSQEISPLQQNRISLLIIRKDKEETPATQVIFDKGQLLSEL